MQQIKTHSKALRQFYFWCGIIATIAYRIIVVLNSYSSFWVSFAWYVGTIGFLLYFWHRYDISAKRAKLITENNLAKKIETNRPLSDNDRAALDYILRTLQSTKEKWNYIVIFTASAVALIIGIYLDFLA